MLDHLVLAAPDLAEAVDYVESITGIRPSPGGAHPKWGTRNALMALGDATYLEIIGPDPEQKDYTSVRPFRIDELNEPKLVTWAAKANDIDAVVARAKERGYDPGEIRDGRRALPDGSILEWRLTTPNLDLHNGLIPFLIDWGNSPHPSATAAAGCRLVSLEVEHPRPKEVSNVYAALDVKLTINEGLARRILAKVDSPKGIVTLK